MPRNQRRTPLSLLADAVRAKASTPGSMDRPAAILWPDRKREWIRILPVARLRIPELLAFGDYDPDGRTGPAIWLRCVVDGTIRRSDMGDRTPIVYLPGVERGQLRAGQDCPEPLRPLVELLYRGVEWRHPNGRDWSVRAFLTRLRADGASAGPGLDIERDEDTREALLRALGKVARTPLDELRGRRLDANDFNRIAGVDIVRDILRWMNDPKATRAGMEDAGWEAFRAEARSELRFDPGEDSDVDAGAKLAEGAGRWGEAWSRFNEAPREFRGVREVLGRSRPGGELVLDRDRWPDLNEEDEGAVRDALAGVPDLPHAHACRRVRELEAEHGLRREWVWAKMGRSPFARALRPLARLAEAVERGMGGRTPDDLARVYRARGWQADRSAREALALAPQGHDSTIGTVVRHLLESWLDDSAKAFQKAVRAHPLRPRNGGAAADSRPAPRPEDDRSAPPDAPVAAEENECILFVDGLRYEVGRCLARRLRERGMDVAEHARWAAIPTVTATAKPAVTPVADRIAGDLLGADFSPVLRGSSRVVDAAVLNRSMEDLGYQIDGSHLLQLGPAAPGARGWSATGRIDRNGHHQGAVEFARSVEREVESVVTRVAELIEAGWHSVRIVTDHGWLLLPGGLPTAPLPKHLTKSKWARCAALSDGATPDAPTWPWHWNRNERFATPPGIACFSRRPEYAHGGLSVQECLTPEIRVGAGAGAGSADAGSARAVVRSVSWRRMRCDVRVEGAEGATADLRLGSSSGRSVASRPKTVDADGRASLVLPDDAHEEDALVVVVIAPGGRVLAQRTTRKGEGDG